MTTAGAGGGIRTPNVHRRGVLEFALGKNQDVAVFTNPRETEDDPKIFFMVRRSDMDGISFPRTKSQEDFDEVAFAKALKDFEKALGGDEEDGATEE
jgi:citrate lyase beta subunit